MSKYETRDLPLAAFLLCIGEQIQEIRKAGKAYYFHFEIQKETKKEIDGFYIGNCKVDPSEYYQKIKKIKNMIYSKEDSHG